MANNDKLVTTASSGVLGPNETDDVVVGHDVATALVVTDGEVGDDTILDFGTNDSLINYRQISDDAVAHAVNGTFKVDSE